MYIIQPLWEISNAAVHKELVMAYILVWDLETVPDLRGFAAANALDGKSDDEVRAAIGDKFPKHVYYSIVCIGALIAHQANDHWVVARC